MRKTLSLATALLAATAGPLLAPAQANAAEFKDYYITTVHVDGKTSIHGDGNHGAEAFPESPLPAGAGLVRTPPNEEGAWKMRAFIFEPSQIVVREGAYIRLNFVGVQGMHHSIRVEGEGIDTSLSLDRGNVQSVELADVKAGMIHIICDDHQPSMNSEVVVLPAG
jgi:hypothetical protein